MNRFADALVLDPMVGNALDDETLRTAAHQFADTLEGIDLRFAVVASLGVTVAHDLVARYPVGLRDVALVPRVHGAFDALYVDRAVATAGAPARRLTSDARRAV